MALKATVETLDDVPEAFRSEYQEVDGKFFLSVDNPDALPDVANLKSAYERVKASDKDKATKLADALAKLEAKPNPTEKDDAEIVKLRQSLEAEVGKWKGDAEALQARVHKLTVEAQLDAAIIAAGISHPTAIKAAKKLLIDSVKLDGDSVVVDSDMGPLEVGKYVKTWAVGEGSFLVSQSSGGGATGAKTGGAGKTISAAELDGMSPKQKADFFAKNKGVQVV